MYIPKHFENHDQDAIVAFMQRYSFGTIITSADNYPIATHIPFVIDQQGDEVIISSHFAKANPQAQQIINNEILVIFTEPHAYISPKHYEKELSVPTWNYIAVHTYGKASILSQKQNQLNVMEKMIKSFDVAYLEKWNNMPDEFRSKMLNGIVAFEIKVTKLQGVNKLSQNRSETERNNIVNAFEKSSDVNEQQIAEYMKDTKK